MSKDRLENIFHKKLKAEELQPASSMWTSIEAELNQKNSKRSFLTSKRVLFVGFLLISAIISSVYMFSVENEEASVDIEKAEIQTDKMQADVQTIETVSDAEASEVTVKKTNVSKVTLSSQKPAASTTTTSKHTNFIEEAVITQPKVISADETKKTTKTIILYEVDTTFVSDTVVLD